MAKAEERMQRRATQKPKCKQAGDYDLTARDFNALTHDRPQTLDSWCDPPNPTQKALDSSVVREGIGERSVENKTSPRGKEDSRSIANTNYAEGTRGRLGRIAVAPVVASYNGSEKTCAKNLQ